MQRHSNLHLQTPSFPLLPIPLLLSSTSDHDLFTSCFSSASASLSDSGHDLATDFSRHLDTLPIGDALCTFLSSVLPQPIEVRSLGVQLSEDKVNNATGANEVNWVDIIQFEVPELGQFLEGANRLEQKEAEILSKVLVCDDKLEMEYLAESEPHLHEVQRSVYSVEDVPPVSSMNVKIFISEDNDFSQRKYHFSDTKYPLLELEEITRDILSVISMEDELQKFIASMEALNAGNSDEVNWQELFFSMEIERISNQISSKLLLEPLAAHPNLFLETGYECLTELSCTEEETGFDFIMDLVDSDFSVELLPFEELMMLDPEYSDISDALTNPHICRAIEKYEKSSLKHMNSKSFNELIVSPEISMVDHNFKSFPVPILPDDEEVQSLYSAITEVLDGLKSLPMSASDEIYLDWDLLGKDNGNCDIHATIQRMFSDVGKLKIGYDIQCAEDSGLLFDFILSDDLWNEITRENKINMLSGGNTAAVKPLSTVSTDTILKDGHTRGDGGRKKVGADSVLLKAESFNQLDFFLNRTKTTTGLQPNVRSEKLHAESTTPYGICQDRDLSSLCTGIQMDKWYIKLHAVNLPANMLNLIHNFEKSFLSVTEDLHLNSRQFSFPIADGGLSLPEEKLIECMKILFKDKSFSGHTTAVTSAFCTLFAIKRMAWCLCSYGIHSLHEFIDQVLQKVECLRSRLALLMPFIDEAYMLANKEITKLHPSLALIQEILGTSTNKRSKILIVAEQNVWWPLKSLLSSMNVKVNEVASTMHGYFPDASSAYRTSESKRSAAQSVCLLAQYEHISKDIQLNQFNIILEYGGLRTSSQLISILPKPIYSLDLHFLKVELDGAAKALCTGVNIPLSSMNQEELLNFVPIVENCKSMSMDTVDHELHCCMPLPVESIPLISKSYSPDLSSCPHTTIIVNTQDFDTEMIISQRSTYQRILAMEKEGAQILERDFCLPVDIIISAGTCLAWYNCKNIGKKATAPDEAASSVPLCVDNIATNVLTTLSFTFRICIMVFEGDSDFLATILESSDELYAAAASLGIELQIFCSHSPELTEEIVLNCITYGMKFHNGLFPKLSESETIAESFLMKFPSINPLSALAILSTGAMLVEFFGLSEESRIRALHKYHVPSESIVLLSILSKYGKRGESISCMTDCSSSVSSAPNSERLVCKFTFEKRKREFNGGPFDTADDFKIYHTNNVNVDNMYKPTMSRLQNRSAELPLCDEAFCEELRSENAAKINLNINSGPRFAWSSRDPNLTDDIPGANFPSGSRFSGHEKPSARLPGHDADIFKCLSDDFMDEIVDMHDETLFGGNFASAKKTANFFLSNIGTDENCGMQSSKAARRLSFEDVPQPRFPTASQIESDSFLWSSQEDDTRIRQDDGSQDTNNGFDISGLDRQTERPATYFQKLLSKEKAPYSYDGTPLRRSINSKELEGASPWTKDFLNQVREKIKLHKQYVKSETPTPRSDYCNNASKTTKRKSPSILELFKYQAGKTPSKSARQVRQKQCTQPPSSSRNDSFLRPRILTPIDKRATKNLSFATPGEGGQTKLVWTDRGSESPAKRFRRSG